MLQSSEFAVDGAICEPVRTTERITGVEKRTILSLLELVGEHCHKLVTERIKGLKVKEVVCQEVVLHRNAGLPSAACGDSRARGVLL